MPEICKDANTLKQFTNCKILRDEKIIKNDFWIRNGKFIDPEKIFFDEKTTPDLSIDCKGALISPGFIDVQINGNKIVFLQQNFRLNLLLKLFY